MFFVYLIIIGICICIFISTVEYFINWHDKNYQIKYRQFISLYYICPEKWTLYKGNVAYDKYSNDGRYIGSIHLYFNFIDYIRYRLFEKEINKKDMLKAKNKIMRQLVLTWQKDIDEYRKIHLDLKGDNQNG